MSTISLTFFRANVKYVLFLFSLQISFYYVSLQRKSEAAVLTYNILLFQVISPVQAFHTRVGN